MERNKYCRFYGAFSLKPDNVRNRPGTMPNKLHGFNKISIINLMLAQLKSEMGHLTINKEESGLFYISIG